MCLYVRDLQGSEGQRLQRLLRRGAHPVEVRRAQIVLASAQGARVPDIAHRLYFSSQHIRTIIKAFNARGFASLAPQYKGGRPPKLSEEQRSLIIETALCPPDLLGQPFRRWSLAKLRTHLQKQKIVETISLESLRQLLRSAKVRLQRTKTWKECNDPKLKVKKN